VAFGQGGGVCKGNGGLGPQAPAGFQRAEPLVGFGAKPQRPFVEDFQFSNFEFGLILVFVII
jgi:hypothetical protein